MDDFQRPCLIGCDTRILQEDGTDYLQLGSGEGLSEHCLRVREEIGLFLGLFDGRYTLEEIRRQVATQTGIRVRDGFLDELVQQLDEICVLDTPRYRQRKQEVVDQFLRSPVREPAHAGAAYPADPDALREQLRGMFLQSGGPGLPDPARDRRHSEGSSGKLRGILSPHIDFDRSGTAFAWAFEELVEHSSARIFVILGTSHYSLHRFVLSRKDFRTPLGVARTHERFVEIVADTYGETAFDDEPAHMPEHSIEFQVLLLQYLLASAQEFAIVPLLVGSFHDSVEEHGVPIETDEIRRMVDALRHAEETVGEEVCYIASGDLAHIGQNFGDPWTIDEQRSQWCRRKDEDLLQSLVSGRSSNLAGFIVDEQDKRRVCGYPPTYMMLEVTRPSRGKLLCYDQFEDPDGREIVSFASVAFYE